MLAYLSAQAAGIEYHDKCQCDGNAEGRVSYPLLDVAGSKRVQRPAIGNAAFLIRIMWQINYKCTTSYFYAALF